MKQLVLWLCSNDQSVVPGLGVVQKFSSSGTQPWTIWRLENFTKPHTIFRDARQSHSDWNNWKWLEMTESDRLKATESPWEYGGKPIGIAKTGMPRFRTEGGAKQHLKLIQWGAALLISEAFGVPLDFLIDEAVLLEKAWFSIMSGRNWWGSSSASDASMLK